MDITICSNHNSLFRNVKLDIQICFGTGSPLDIHLGKQSLNKVQNISKSLLPKVKALRDINQLISKIPTHHTLK